jgi:hypothetical protein
MLLLTLSVQTKTKSWQQSRLFVKLVDSIAPSYVMTVYDWSATVNWCCQVAEIPAKKLKKGRGKKVGWKNSWPKFGRMLPKGTEKNFLKKFFILQ